MELVPAKGFSLWLMPEGEPRERLATWIGRLAARLGTASFPPHLTLVSGIETIDSESLDRTAQAATMIAPLSLTLGAIEGREEHFRCLFLRVRASRALRTAHTRAARALGLAPAADFLPHVSLVYGTLAPAEKRAIVGEIGDALALHFEVRRLHLWRTEGPAPEWRERAALDLAPPSGQAVPVRKRRAVHRS
jgi:2'-5' RNA ligase